MIFKIFVVLASFANSMVNLIINESPTISRIQILLEIFSLAYGFFSSR